MSARLRTLHAAGGVLLGAYAGYHLFLQLAALDGRDAWAERARSHGLGAGLAALVVAAFGGHALLGLFRQREARRLARAQSAAPDAAGTFQLVTGAVMLAFLVLHVLQTWPFSSGPQLSPLDAHQVLWSTLGQPAQLVAYVVGATALAFHFGTGATRLAARHAPSWRGGRYLAFILGAVLWLGYLQVIAYFAIGEALIPL